MNQKKLKVNLLLRGSVWLDTGTIESLLQANQYVEVIERRQGRKIGCIEEAAYIKGLIDDDQLLKLSRKLMKSGYGKYLKKFNKMKIISTEIEDLFIIQPEIFSDDRGYFFESFNEKKFNENFSQIKFCQDNESKSSFWSFERLHYQLSPKAQTKLVRVLKGKVLDVVVDIRQNSPSFGNHFSVELSDENKKQLLIPRGFAHGFVVLSDEAVFSCKVDNYYDSKLERV